MLAIVLGDETARDANRKIVGVHPNWTTSEEHDERRRNYVGIDDFAGAICVVEIVDAQARIAGWCAQTRCTDDWCHLVD